MSDNYMAKRRKRLIDSGLCTQCGKVAAKEGTVFCEKHYKTVISYQREWARRYAKKYPKRTREVYVKRKYNLTAEQYTGMLKKCKNMCESCQDNLTEPHVDHDHACCEGLSSCGKCVRGLLCKRCNTALGMLGDSLETIKRLTAYLKKHKKRIVGKI